MGIMAPNSRIYVAGHTGLVGGAIFRALSAGGYRNVLVRTHAELDLTDRVAVNEFFSKNTPEYVFLAAGIAGGIRRNQDQPAEMLYLNLAIQNNVLDAAYRRGVRKLIFPGSACAYPKECPQPITPDRLLTGPVEPSSEPFAIAKIAGLRMCQAYHQQYGALFVPVIPATVYGPGDHFDDNGHVISSLIARFESARREGTPSVTVWGTGRARREFIYCDDLADALVQIMLQYEGPDIVHMGTGEDVSIAELAELVRSAVGYQGEIVFDPTRPDGMPRRLLDSGPIRALGWKPQTGLADGLRRTVDWYRNRLTGFSREETQKRAT